MYMILRVTSANGLEKDFLWPFDCYMMFVQDLGMVWCGASLLVVSKVDIVNTPRHTREPDYWVLSVTS